jgi:double-strand break repair protein MRE11
VNYEDEDINVAIPVFSIHGNHDDPSGEGHLAALDLLQIAGLINYYGRTPESDNILVKPILLQKGNTKLALYGMSNVRDERLFRTFRDGNVKFFQPSLQKDDWFNLLSVHQNHHAYTETGYLPENFLPDFMDLVVWGHEHECKIDPITNPETSFRVMQPGSSVATSLVPGEAVEKRIAILNIRGKDMDVETIRLKTVRPFKYKELALSDFKEMRDIALKQDNQAKVHQFLTEVVDEMIAEAKDEWLELQRENAEEVGEDAVAPLPLVRLRVEITPPEGGNYAIENPQRFSNRFVDRVANKSDVIQTHRKRKLERNTKAKADLPDADMMAQLSLDSVKVDKLVQEFLTAQSLSILPQNQFSESVGQFVNKDDKNAMHDFVDQSLEDQLKQLLAAGGEDFDDEETAELMEKFKEAQEEAYARGEIKRRQKRKGSRKERPDRWDSDLDGPWEDNPASIIRDDEENEDGTIGLESRESSVAPAAGRGRGRGRGGRVAANGTTRKTAAATKKAPEKSTTSRNRKKQVDESDEEEEEDDDVIMLDDDDDDDDEGLFVRPTAKKATSAKAPAKKAPAKTSTRGGRAPASSGGRQSQINFGNQAPRATASRAAAPRRLQEPSDDEISDDDAFEPPPPTVRTSRR